MAVPVPQRRESKLEVQVKCEEMVSHTIHITSNPNVFDPKYQAFINRIVDTAKRMRRKVSGLSRLEAMGARPPGTCDLSYEGWRAHAAKGDSRLLLEKTDKWYSELRKGTA